MDDAIAKILLLLGLMAAVSLVELWIPFRTPGTRSPGPNLVLTLLFLALNLALTAPLLLAAEWMDAAQVGHLNRSGLSEPMQVVAGIVLLDLGAYAAHVLMHKVPWLWRFHRVHHSDTLVDVTTAFRQHPGETALRMAFTAGPALLLGASAETIALYRTLSGISAIFEHANVRLPEWLDRPLRAVIVGPTLHKVHHSRIASETDSNYGNIFSLFDRAFGTFTPASHACRVRYGLDGHDAPMQQTARGLLRLPWR
ncbi:MAG TPA: sterol desaturase family protein [Verrucomicrobiae bacterium]|nr:sterol desaturase family protein [Verrucomicrobiae bacterium]